MSSTLTPNRRLFVTLCLSAAFLLSGCATAPPPGVSAVSPFDLQRYLGTWFEVARLDHRFERGLSQVSATYSLNADGSVKVLSPLPAWLKPGRVHVLMTVESVEEKPQRRKLATTPEKIARRVTALEKVRKLNPYHDIAAPVEWQREMREDRPLPGREWRLQANKT